MIKIGVWGWEFKPMCIFQNNLQDGGSASHDAKLKFGRRLVLKGKVNFNCLLGCNKLWNYGIEQSWNLGFVIRKSRINFLIQRSKNLYNFLFPRIDFPKYDKFEENNHRKHFSVYMTKVKWVRLNKERISFYKLSC